MKVLVTGAAGFIGSALVGHLLARGDEVVGVDNHNDYYDPAIKDARVARWLNHSKYTHLRLDISNYQDIKACFLEYSPQRVVNLAAQVGVRYSIENPFSYINTNIVGFSHILECSRQANVEHLVYASSSSVYGANAALPFATRQNVDHPLNIYAATKKSNELMAHAYSHLYNLPTTGLRFFTVYGPWGRPDMALFQFTQAILANQPVRLFNHGRHYRDFTYIDDIVQGLLRVLDGPAKPKLVNEDLSPERSTAPWRIYNIGNSKAVQLQDYVEAIEKALNKKAMIEHLPIQAGDMLDTYADMQDFVNEFDFRPATNVQDGVKDFVSWYREYYKI